MTQPTRVLILEDEILVAWSLQEVLNLVGYEVTGIAATVHDALCLAEVTRPDLAIVDVRLAGQRDGIEGAELLRQQFGLAVIFLTGEVDKETAQRASKVNPICYLVKPVHSQQLVDAIRTAPERSRKWPAVADENTNSATARWNLRTNQRLEHPGC
jgi:DNA-binding NarL/FixJ family response regulator